MLLRNLFKKYKDDSQFVSLFSCWLEHQQGPCRNEGPERQDSTKLVHPKESRCPTCVSHPNKKPTKDLRRDVKGLTSLNNIFLQPLSFTQMDPSLEFMEHSWTGEPEPFPVPSFFCVYMCVWRALFFSVFGSSCYGRTHVNLVYLLQRSLSAVGPEKNFYRS